MLFSRFGFSHLCELRGGIQDPSGIHVKDLAPRIVQWFQKYVKSLDDLQFCGDRCTVEDHSLRKIEGKTSEDNNVEVGEMVNNNKLKYSEAESSELAQSKTECDVRETSCSSDEDCKQCSDCPNGAYCILKINYAGTKLFRSCECSEDYYEYDNTMDYFNAKSNKIQSENEDKVIELGEMINNNLEDSEAAPSELAKWTTECDIYTISCSMDEHCKELRRYLSKECSDCTNGGYCDLEYITNSGIWGACDCIEGLEIWGGK